MTGDLFEASNVRRVYAVSELTAAARQAIEDTFPPVWVEGEVSNLRQPGSGHWYFSLADARAQLRCVMFASRNRFVRTRIANGLHVLVRCRLSLYEGRGEFQGIGGQLEREGLFAAERKRPLPAFPRHVGVVSSLSGAALQDVLAVLRRRFPCVEVTCFPVAVQGPEAVSQIVAALDRAQRTTERPDLLLLTRGGGSLEDLAAFNSEAVARRIAACAIPVVSAVGHEVDVTIADLVADRRAATPSAAAELIAPEREDLLRRLAGSETRLSGRMSERIGLERVRLRAASARLVDPVRALEQQMQRADDLRERRQAHPGGDDRLPLLGSFALRGARPNPLAVTVCRLRGIEGSTLRVEGLDLVDGTPVLDVKPYIAVYDAVPDAKLPRWAQG